MSQHRQYLCELFIFVCESLCELFIFGVNQTRTYKIIDWLVVIQIEETRYLCRSFRFLNKHYILA